MTITTDAVHIGDALNEVLAALRAEVAEKMENGEMLPPKIEANARELDEIRAAKKVIEKREEVLRTTLIEYLDSVEKDAVEDGDVAISRSKYDRKNIDRKKMEALYPKVLAAVETTTPVVQIRVEVKKVKG